MKRRRFIALSGAAAAGLVAGGVALRRASLPTPELGKLIEQLNALRGETLGATGAWSPAMIFTHLAQSVDYSISGYPEMKPALFRQTIGGAAFLAFSTAGAMRHNLAEVIPGAPTLVQGGSSDAALDRLVASLLRFEAHAAELKPHFAYGDLGKDDYRAAHIFHVRNHLDEIVTV